MGGPGYCNNKTYNCFDNFFPAVFTMDGKLYKSSEQCYQASKFVDEKWSEKIRNTYSSDMAYDLGQDRFHKLIDNFEEKKVELMYKANFAKFSQNKSLRDTLLSTGDHKISFTGSTNFWNKYNAEILMRIRSELREIFTI